MNEEVNVKLLEFLDDMFIMISESLDKWKEILGIWCDYYADKGKTLKYFLFKLN